jgi:hypothetical protein
MKDLISKTQTKKIDAVAGKVLGYNNGTYNS